MTNSIYKECIDNVSQYMDLMKALGLEYTAFDASKTLSICFNLPKEKTLKDIIKYREKSK